MVINVLDASNLERNLYLTCQLIDMGRAYDYRAQTCMTSWRNGATSSDYQSLAQMIGCPHCPRPSAKPGFGIEELFNRVIKVYEEEKTPVLRHIHINYGEVLEKGINHVKEALKQTGETSKSVSKRYLSIKLLEKDNEVEARIKEMQGAEAIFQERDRKCNAD